MEGAPFGRYRLVELLGRGGMGEVWRAFDTATERVVALKLLPANLADDRVFQERFRREARAAAGLDEPHVVPIYDFGEIDEHLYVTMRLIDGQDLLALLNDGPIEPARAVGIIEQIASALHAAHRIGLVHRDVKPSNILVAEDDFAYLIDFGIARAIGDTQVTSTGSTVGTWAYMAPERFRTGAADARTDVYALACVLYQSLTGQPPFPGTSLEQVAAAHLFAAPPRPSTVTRAVPPAIDDVIATGMAKDPDHRYATTKDLARAARAVLTSSTSSTAPASLARDVLPPAEPIAIAPGNHPLRPSLAAAPASVSTLSAADGQSRLLDQPLHTRRGRWIAVSTLLILLLAGGIVLTFFMLRGNPSPGVSQENQVRQAIQDFDVAIQKGDLVQLRNLTCGRVHDSYVNYPENVWAATHERVASAKQYPVIASIDRVLVHDKQAEANVTTFMAYAPDVRSTRSFDLQFLDGRWKICEGVFN